MKITPVHKVVTPPVEKYILELSPEELRYIRYLIYQQEQGASADLAAADRLYSMTECVKDVPLNGDVCFK